MKSAKNKINNNNIEAFLVAKNQVEDVLYKKGEEAGAAFVTPDTYLEMKRLSRWRDDLGYDLANLFSQGGIRIICLIMSSANYIKTETDLRAINGENVEDETWLLGFVTGALEKFSYIDASL